MHIAHAFWLIKRQIIKRTVWGCIATYAKINRGEYGIYKKKTPGAPFTKMVYL